MEEEGGGVVIPTGTTTPVKDTTYQNLGGRQNQKVDYTNEYRADINDSGLVDIFDYNLLMVNWGKYDNTLNKTLSRQDRCNVAVSLKTNKADINCDGLVDVLDFNLVLIYWGKYIGEQGVELRNNTNAEINGIFRNTN